MIKAIVFDFGGVVVPGILLNWVKGLNDDHPKYKMFMEASHKWDLGQLSIDEFYEAVSKITDIPEDKVRSVFYSKAKLYPEVIVLIESLKANYKIVLFTNNFAHNVEKYLEALQIQKLFDEVIISSDHKIKKPNPAFYQILIDMLGMKPEEMIFIDDTQENVDTGNRLGIKSFLFVDLKILEQDLKKEGVKI